MRTFPHGGSRGRPRARAPQAIHAWRAASEAERLWICGAYFHYSGGFTPPRGEDISPYPGRSDPVYVVSARKLEPLKGAAGSKEEL